MNIDQYSQAAVLLLQLNEELQPFRNQVISGDVRVDALWKIPFRQAASLTRGSMKAIKPNLVLPKDKKQIFADSLVRTKKYSIQNGRETFRVIGCAACEESIIRKLGEINLLRTQLKDSILHMPPRDRKFFWNNHLNLFALQTMREPLIPGACLAGVIEDLVVAVASTVRRRRAVVWISGGELAVSPAVPRCVAGVRPFPLRARH